MAGLWVWAIRGSQIKGLNPLPREDTCSDVTSLKARTYSLTQKQNLPSHGRAVFPQEIPCLTKVSLTPEHLPTSSYRKHPGFYIPNMSPGYTRVPNVAAKGLWVRSLILGVS